MDSKPKQNSAIVRRSRKPTCCFKVHLRDWYMYELDQRKSNGCINLSIGITSKYHLSCLRNIKSYYIYQEEHGGVPISRWGAHLFFQKEMKILIEFQDLFSLADEVMEGCSKTGSNVSSLLSIEIKSEYIKSTIPTTGEHCSANSFGKEYSWEEYSWGRGVVSVL